MNSLKVVVWAIFIILMCIIAYYLADALLDIPGSIGDFNLGE